MTPLKIGSRVITRKFETKEMTDENVHEVHRCVDGMLKFDGKEGDVTEIDGFGNIRVHNYYWPPSAVELVSPPFQPEYGKEYEFSNGELKWERGVFMIKDGDIYVMKGLNSYHPYQYQPYKHIRPIRKGLEDEIREACQNNVRADKILSIIANHRTEPSDEEIKQFWHSLNLRQSILDSVVETVRHFLSKQ